MAKIFFYGGAKSVTGANYLFTTKKHRVLVDCGLFQGSHFCEPINHEPFQYDPKTIDCIFLTHSHLDHIGRVAKLVKDGFSGKIYSTSATLDFTYISLLDAAHLLKEDEKRHKEILFDEHDIEKTKKLFVPVDYGTEIPLSKDFSFILHDAGHILGSAFVEIKYKEGDKDRTIVFSGDLGNSPSPLLNDTEKLVNADYLLVESAYGDRLHNDILKRQDLLEDAIEDTFKEGGVLLIPSFAMERTQELLYELNALVEEKRVPKIPVFVDGPLAIRMTEIFKKHPEFYNEKAAGVVKSGDEIFNFPGLHFTMTSSESKKINDVPAPKIIIAGSGMLNGGRIGFHLIRYLSDKKSTLLFVGYQVAGSLGRRILEGEKEVFVLGGRVKVNCNIKKIEGYSAHADRKAILNWIGPMRHRLKKVFVVQGEDNAANSLACGIIDEIGVDAIAPELSKSETLD